MKNFHQRNLPESVPQTVRSFRARIQGQTASAMLAALFLGLAFFETCAAGDLSGNSRTSDVQDLVGTWTIEQGESMTRSGGRPSRVIEFLPDGTAFETTTYPTSGGGTSTNRRKRSWTAQDHKIVVTDPGGDRPGGTHTLEIPLPFDKNRLEITETFHSQDMTQTNTMYATMTGPAASSSPSSSVPGSVQGTVPDSGAQTKPAQPASTKILLSVTPSVKNSTEGYYKIQKLSLTITLKNSDLKVSSGPLTVNFWILGKQGQGGKQFCLLKSGNFTTTLGTEFTNRETKTSTEPTMNRFYSYSSCYYAEYEGWIVSVKNSDGQLVAVKASKPDWERQLAKADALERGLAYDLKLNKLDGMRSYYCD